MASCSDPGLPRPRDLTSAEQAEIEPFDKSSYAIGVVAYAEFTRTAGGIITGIIELVDGTRLTIRDANAGGEQCYGGGANFELDDGALVANPTGCLAVASLDPNREGPTLELLEPSPQPSPPRWGLIGAPLAIGAETLVVNTRVLDRAALRIEGNPVALRREVLEYGGRCPDNHSIDEMVILVDDHLTVHDFGGYAVSPFDTMGSKCGYVR